MTEELQTTQDLPRGVREERIQRAYDSIDGVVLRGNGGAFAAKYVKSHLKYLAKLARRYGANPKTEKAKELRRIRLKNIRAAQREIINAATLGTSYQQRDCFFGSLWYLTKLARRAG